MNPLDIFLVAILSVAFGWSILFAIGITVSAFKELMKMIKQMMED